MLYTANQARQKVKGLEVENSVAALKVQVDAKELETVTGAINEAIEQKQSYCSVGFHVSKELASELDDLGYAVSCNVCNKRTYISWVS